MAEAEARVTVNIALVDAGRPVLGVVHAPALGLTYWGSRNLGAWRQAAGESRLESAGEIVVAAQRADLHAHPTGDRMHRAEVGGLHGGR